MFGVRASQDHISLAQIQEHIWEHRPDLILEVGTECGGLASIMAELQHLTGVDGKVLTMDIAPQGYAPWAHQDCELRRGNSSLWHKHQASGRLQAILRDTQKWGCHCKDCVCVKDDLDLLQLMQASSKEALNIFIIDDSSHFKDDVVNNFRLLAPFVKRGSFYVVADSRLDRLCETVKRLGYQLPNGFNPGEQVQCDYYIDNGPAAGIAAVFRSGLAERFQIDRGAEHLILGSNPGGWLRAI